MAKLGKRARKFAKKHLQPLLKRRRKLKSMFKKKYSKRNNLDADEDQENEPEVFYGRKQLGDDIEDSPLDAVFGEDDSGIAGDDSETDGYLSEDSSFEEIADIVGQTCMQNSNNNGVLSMKNMDLYSDLEKKREELETLKQKDHGFSKFLKDCRKSSQISRNEGNKTDDDETSEDGLEMNGTGPMHGMFKLLTSTCVDSLCQLVTEKHSKSAFTFLLNAYRNACLNKSDEASILGGDSVHIIQNGETSSKILMFMLCEADNVFRSLLGITNSNNKDKALELKNLPKWGKIKQLLRSYLRSTLIFLNQVTDSEILAFTITQLRASIILFAAFPSLLHRLIKVCVHLWLTSKGSVSSYSFLLIQDVASQVGASWFDTCQVKMYKAFISQCHFVEPAILEHIQFLRDSFAELCTLDVQKSSVKVKRSVQQLAKILKKAWLAKKEEEVKKISSWQFINCIDLCATFISKNTCDYDLQALLFMIIQIIYGVALLFPGARYFPMRLKCVRWLNYLSKSSGIFIPIISLVLDILEYKISKEVGKIGPAVDLNCTIKVPKYWLKSKRFQEECVLSVIELLSQHFAQWSYHISFPELATIPVIRLRNFYEITTIESSRRVIKRFLDQVEQNIEFVQKRRDEVIFSPKDLQSVESFLQLEKCSGDAPFLQYYKSISNKSASGKNIQHKSPGAKDKRKLQRPNGVLNSASLEGHARNGETNLSSTDVGKRKKRRKSNANVNVVT